MGFFDLFRQDHAPLVERGFTDIRNMLRTGQEMFSAATATLLDNAVLDVDLKQLDQTINEGEQNLRRAVLEHLTIEPDRELLFSLKLLSIVHEAERIGDLAKTLARTATLARQPRVGPTAATLRALRDRVDTLFEEAVRVFVEADEEAARRLLQAHEQIKDDVGAVIADLAGRDDITVNEGVVYALSARMIGRVSSHLSNIASAVASPFDRILRNPAPSG